MRQFVSVLATVTVAATLSVGVATARAAGGDTTVVAVNTKDGKFLYRVRLDLRRRNGDTVDTSNAAVAVASCDACETVAVSIQVLLVFSEPTTVTPENLALAMNVDCSFCQTLASAYQFLLETDGPVHLTANGNREVAHVRRELESIRTEGLSIWEIQARVDALANELAAVLATELVAAGRP
jgi:putative peptide zinc metalloprotease protein